MSREIHYYNAAEPGKVRFDWWSKTIPEERRHENIWSIVRGIAQKQAYRSRNNLSFARLYHNMEIMGFDPGMFSRVPETQNYLSNRVTLNIIKSCVDTVSSKIAKSKPRPYFLTENGNWSLQQKAKKLTQYMDGWFLNSETYEKSSQIFIDGCVFGTGALKIFRDGDQVKTERVFIDEIIVDEAEGIYGSPRQLHQKKAVFREVLAQAYPEHKNKIMTATSSLHADYSSDYYADMVYVIESWHLPSSKDATDGRHTISIENCTLFDEQYDKETFPFCFFRWTNALMGFYGMGLAEELVGIQLEINKILRNIQQSQRLMAVPQIWLEGNSQVVSQHINNEIGGIKRYVGTPPIFQVPPAMSPEIYGYLENLVQKAFQITGVSETSAQSKKPSGVTAAVAMQTLSDMESERFMLVSQRFEKLHLDIAKQAIDITKDIFTESNVSEIKCPGKEFMTTIKWKDVDLNEDQYLLACYPTNLLPTQPAGRLDRIQSMMQAGFFDREDAVALLDYPDIKQVTSRITGARDDVMMIIGKILDSDEYTTPEPYMKLDLAKSIAQLEYNKAKANNVPETKLELLRRFMDDCDALEQQAIAALQEEQMMQQQAAMGPPMAPPMGPMAQPEVAPTSELLPIA